MSITLLRYFADKAQEISDGAFAGIRSLGDWKGKRGELLRRFYHSMGLEGLPEGVELDMKEHGELEGKGYFARKVSYRILPDCYGSGIVFYPDPLPRERSPAVLYLCGHSNFGILDYHPHAIMWARRGYVCLIIDTIRQTDNTGEHSGFSRHGREDWISMGYTPAGGELLNGWGALNLLCSLPEVDAGRIGATGLSGGGAHCFFLGIADERVKAVASTCGVVSLGYTIRNRSFNSNCDCMFWYNLYQHDTSEYGALIAPRPLLFAHARGDYLFTPEENVALHRSISRVYELYGCPGDCALFQFDGPHSYQPSSVKAINDWFDLHLSGGPMKELGLGQAELDEKRCSIWNGNHPVPDRLDILPEILTPPRSFPIPDTLAELTALKRKVMKELDERVFNYVVTSRETLEMELIHEWILDPERPHPLMRKYRGFLGGMELWVTVHLPGSDVKDMLVYLCDQNEDDVKALATLPVDASKLGIITVEPRAGGLNSSNPAWSVGVLKAGLYLGLTPITMWMKDLKELMAWFRDRGELRGRNVYLYGAKDAGVASLYYTLMDDGVSGVIMKDLYHSHRVGGHILGVLKVLDIEQALGLLAPRVIGIDTHEWEYVFWSVRVYQRLGIRERFVHTHSTAHTLARIFPG